MANSLHLNSQGDGHTLLCLHGLGGKGQWFDGLSNRLRDNYRIITLDLPGTGYNRVGFSPFTAVNCLHALAALIETLPGPLTLVGQSMGTILALKLHAQMPGRFHSLACIGGLPEIIPTIRERLTERRTHILQHGLTGLGMRAAKGVFAKSTFESQPHLTESFATEFEAQPVDEYLEGIDILLSTSAKPEVSTAKLPCLILSGSEDSYAPPSEIQKFADTLPGPIHRVEVPNCGHMVFLEATDVFCEKIKSILQEKLSVY